MDIDFINKLAEQVARHRAQEGAAAATYEAYAHLFGRPLTAAEVNSLPSGSLVKVSGSSWKKPQIWRVDGFDAAGCAVSAHDFTLSALRINPAADCTVTLHALPFPPAPETTTP